MANILEMYRGQFGQELATNPDLRTKLMASIQAEVGNQSDEAKLAYVESVMNRAAARGMSLDQTISDTSYYPKATTSQLGRTPSQDEQAILHPIIANALSGSNISNLATGNKSGKVRSGEAPVTFDPGTGERFILENPDKKWVTGLNATGPGGSPPMTPLIAGPDYNAFLNDPNQLARMQELQAAMHLSSLGGDAFSSGGNLSFG